VRIIENRNKSVVNRIRQQIKDNDGYCLCANKKDDTPRCNCRLYEKAEL